MAEIIKRRDIREVRSLLCHDDSVAAVVMLIEHHLTLEGAGATMQLHVMPPAELIHAAALRIAQAHGLATCAEYGNPSDKPHLFFRPLSAIQES